MILMLIVAIAAPQALSMKFEARHSIIVENVCSDGGDSCLSELRADLGRAMPVLREVEARYGSGAAMRLEEYCAKSYVGRDSLALERMELSCIEQSRPSAFAHIASAKRTLPADRRAALVDGPLPRPITPSEQAAIRKEMDLHLRDGLSARYRFPRRRHVDAYCFWVNAKNGFGAYSGWKLIEAVVLTLPKQPTSVIIMPGGDEAAEADCARYGYTAP